MTYRMTAQTFRFHSHQFQSRVRSAFEPRKPRHRLLRFAVGLVGLALIVLLVMFGVVVGAAMPRQRACRGIPARRSMRPLR